MNGFPQKKTLFNRLQDRKFSVFTTAFDGSERPLQFSSTDIQEIRRLNENLSVITLNNHLEIRVALDCNALKRRIYDLQEPDTDLRNVTGRYALVIGETIPDGTVYAGISPATNQPMYTTPANAPKLMNLAKAGKYVDKMNINALHARNDWRLPTADELAVLFHHREQGALKNSFNGAAQKADDREFYWSLEKEREYAILEFTLKVGTAVHFPSGLDGFKVSESRFSIRPIRSRPRA